MVVIPDAVPFARAGFPSNVPKTLGVKSSTANSVEASSGFLLYSTQHKKKSLIVLDVLFNILLF